jgi:hypothetical protein
VGLVRVDVQRHVRDERVDDQEPGVDLPHFEGNFVEVVGQGDVAGKAVPVHLHDVDTVEVGPGGDQPGDDHAGWVIFAAGDDHVDGYPVELARQLPPRGEGGLGVQDRGLADAVEAGDERDDLQRDPLVLEVVDGLGFDLAGLDEMHAVGANIVGRRSTSFGQSGRWPCLTASSGETRQ